MTVRCKMDVSYFKTPQALYRYQRLLHHDGTLGVADKAWSECTNPSLMQLPDLTYHAEVTRIGRRKMN